MNTNPIYNVSWFIKKFEAIPVVKWATCMIKLQGTSGEQRCAIGWCRRLIDANTTGWALVGTEEEDALGLLFRAHFNNKDLEGESGKYVVTRINDSRGYGYDQPTPKERILAVLYDIKKLREPEVKERIVYVVVSPELQKLEPCQN